MKHLLSLLCCLSAVAASAQTTPQVAFRLATDTTRDSYSYGAADCNTTVKVQWTNTTAIAFSSLCSSNSMKVWATLGECGDAPGTDDTRYDDIPGVTLQGVKSGSFDVKIAELPGSKPSVDADGGTVINCPAATPARKEHRVCGVIEYATQTTVGCGSNQKYSASPFKLIYDTLPPTKPTITGASGQDGAVSVQFSVDADTVTVTVEVKGPNDADYWEAGTATVANGSTVRGTGLTNNTRYLVRLRGIDAVGNVSEPSDAVEVTPILTQGFFDYYGSQAGADKLEGGCAAAPGLLPLALLALAFRRSRKQGSGSR